MRCKKCGNKLMSTESICTVCGNFNDEELSLENDDLGKYGQDIEVEEFDEDDFDENESSDDDIEVLDDQYEEIDDSTFEDDEEEEYEPKTYTVDQYASAYIGEDYDWIVEKSINIYALLLSWMYFVYRKLYIIGILGLVLTGFAIHAGTMVLIPYIVIVMILSGLFFNKIYLWVINGRVSRIKDLYSDLDGDEIIDICRKKGGVSVIKALIIFFLFLCIMLLTYITIKQAVPAGKFFEVNGENRANCKLTSKEAYMIMQENKIGDDVEKFVCEIVKDNVKKYNIYVKYKEEKTIQYLYFENEKKNLVLKANTKDIEELEKHQEKTGLIEEEKKMLEQSKKLPTKMSELENNAKQEAQKEEAKTDTKERQYYVFSKDDILK